jgi:tetratricopeptide (TPR) repeat protein
MKQQKFFRGTLFAAFVASCATNPATTKQSSESTSASEPASGELVVIQSKSKSPMISGSNMEHWIQLKNSQGSKNRIYGYMATGEWATSIEEAKRALESAPGDNGLIVALAAAYAGQANYEMAGYYAGVVLKTDAGNSDAMNLVGLRIMTGSGNRRADFDDAMNWYRKAAESDGTHIAALLNLGNLQLDLGDASGALESFTMASNRCGQCFASEFGIGLSSSRKGAWAQSVKAFENILARDRSKAEAQYQLALVYKNGLANSTRAVQLLQDIVSDADGRFKHASSIKRVANISLRRIRANDRTAPMPEEALEPR